MPALSEHSLRCALVRRLAGAWLSLLLLCLGSHAFAADYTFPGNLPPGCSGQGPTYQCGALALGAGDTVTFTDTKPVSVTVLGNLTPGPSQINAAGNAADVTFFVSSILFLGGGGNLNANVQGGSVFISGTAASTVGGNLTMSAGITLFNFTKVKGNISSTGGIINIGTDAVIDGNISNINGNTTIRSRTKVGGSMRTGLGAIVIEADAQIVGNIESSGGNITLGNSAKVNGSITNTNLVNSPGSNLIDIGQQASVGACVKTRNSAAGAIKLGTQATVGRVCCGATCENTCVANNSTFAMPPKCFNNLIAQYRMDETSWNGTADEVQDSSGYKFHGTSLVGIGGTSRASAVYGTPAYTNGGQSTCNFGEFDNATGPTLRSLTLVSTQLAPIADSFSFKAWIRPDAGLTGRIVARDDTNYGWAISMGDPGPGKIRVFNRNIGQAGGFSGNVTGPVGGYFNIDTTVALAPNQWYLVGLTVNTSTQTINLYVFDSTLQTEVISGSGKYTGTWSEGPGNLTIGGESPSSSEFPFRASHFAGKIDEVEFYTGVLSSDLVKVKGAAVRTCTVTPTCSNESFANLTSWNTVKAAGSFTPQLVSVNFANRLRLTDASLNATTVAQYKRRYPAAGNKLVIEFDHYVYGGDGGAGLSVVLSDASQAPVAGGGAGSLGYAPNGSAPGFGGGWLGIGIDEFGDFANPSESRSGYPASWIAPTLANAAAGPTPNSVVVRGSGSGTTGYRLLANTGPLSPVVWSGASDSWRVQRYRITVDNSNNTNVYVTVERDTFLLNARSDFVTLVPKFDVRGANSLQDAIPTNFLLSFAATTNSKSNIHEIRNVNVCSNAAALPIAAASSANAFECLETGTNAPWDTTAGIVSNPSKPLYTKLASTNFSFDVAALKTNGALESNYVPPGGDSRFVLTELFDTKTPAASCSAYTNPVASQVLTFASGVFSGEAGRVKTAEFNIPTARSKLLCRVKECTTSACTAFSSVPPACSSDQFAVRPQTFNYGMSGNPGQPLMTNGSLTGNPAAKAGTIFKLDAVTSVTGGYTGTPTIDLTKLVDHNGAAIASGTFSGSFSAGDGTKARGTSFRYLDVGNLQFLQDAIVDSTFTAVDQSNGGCITGSTSNTLTGGKYGCNIGIAQSPKLGRWYPSHYSFSGTLTPSCAAGGFTYMDHDALGVSITIKAHATTGNAPSANDPVVSRYTSATSPIYPRLAPVTLSGDNAGTGVAASRLVSPAFPAMPNTGLWNAGQFVINDTFAFRKIVDVNGKPVSDGPYDSFKLKATLADPDGSTFITTTNETNTTRIRNGQLRIFNAYGSELLDLPVPVEARYWNGSSFVTNTLDSCTTLDLSSIAMSGYTGKLAACETQISPTVLQTLSAGKLPGKGLVLSKPGQGNSGSVQLTMNLGSTASGDTCVSSTASPASAAIRPWFGSNPTAKATFGIFKSPLIYLRENY